VGAGYFYVMSPSAPAMRRATHVANAVLVALVAAAVVTQFDGAPWSEPGLALIIGLAALVPSCLWFAALKIPRNATLAFLALAANAVGMFAAVFVLAGSAGLAAATGTRAGLAVLGGSIIWVLTGALNIRTAWADRFSRASNHAKNAT
jgi:hypothetical protein